MTAFRTHRFPSLKLLQAGAQQGAAHAGASPSHAQDFRQALDDGYREGHEAGRLEGHREGLEQGRAQGLRQGREQGRAEALQSFETLARPVDALLESLEQLRSDYQRAQRTEMVELVAKVARQVIRAELALQPLQLLAMVDETLTTLPATREPVEVYLNPEELQRILELAPQRAARWTMLADPLLALGECRVRAGHHEADAGCRQRLAACIEQVGAQLLDGPQAPEAAA